ncbi:cytochrome P450 [Streptomyces tricolor]|nr:cytochrome P450 [Streptomyces tricolor]
MSSPELERMLRGWFMLMDPPNHTALRRTMQSFFVRSRVDSLAGEFRDIVAARLDQLRPLDHVDLANDFATPVASGVLARVLDVPVDVIAAAAVHMAPIASFLAQPHKREFAERAAAAVGRLDGLYRELAPHLSEGSALFPLLGDDPAAPEAAYLHTAHLLSFAGQETTAGLIASGLLHLLREPRRLPGGRHGAGRSRRGRRGDAALRHARAAGPSGRAVRRDRGGPDHPGRRPRPGAARRREPGLAEHTRRRRPRLHPPAAARAFGVGIHYCLGAPIARGAAKPRSASGRPRSPRPGSHRRRFDGRSAPATDDSNPPKSSLWKEETKDEQLARCGAPDLREGRRYVGGRRGVRLLRDRRPFPAGHGGHLRCCARNTG